MRFLIIFVCLTIAGSALAVPVDPNAPDGVAAIFESGGALFALDTGGQSWIFVLGSENDWEPFVIPGLPEGVALEDVADYHATFLTTYAGARWMFYRFPPIDVWVIVPPLPNDPIMSQQESMGGVKSMFR